MNDVFDDLMDALGRSVTRQVRTPAGFLGLRLDPQLGQQVCFVPPGTTPAEADAMFAAIHPVVYRKVRTKRPLPPPPPPPPTPPHEVLHDGRLVVSVPLGGDLARGRRLFLDLLAWDRVKLLLGTEWVVTEPTGPDGPAYVTSARVKVRATAQRTTGNVVLARWLARAEPGQVVTYRNGDTLDLTGRNLAVVDRAEFWEAHRVRTGRIDTWSAIVCHPDTTTTGSTTTPRPAVLPRVTGGRRARVRHHQSNRRVHMRALLAVAVLLALTSCGPAIVVMKNPTSGEIIQCKGSTTGLSGLADAAAARDCAAGYQAAGWTRMN